ncbi:MAG TPA: general secretion pathway protein GspK [Verrucomicrobiae bacterium]|nr:general secretion pathway protein GspK [Verrucomicrobiae bacterium]
MGKKNRGIAVIVALVAVTVLSIMAGLFAYSMKVETRLASNANHDEEMLWMGRAGVELARYVVSLENKQPYDALNQIWAGGPGAGSETNSPLMGLSLTDYPVGDEGGTITVKIIDLERKVNVNSAPAMLLQQVLTVQGVDAGDITGVSDSILDWVDPDDETRPAGAESDYYQGQNPAYYAKNAPMDDLSELLLLKGVTRAMYEGGEETNSMGAAFQHHKMGFGNAPGETPVYAFGLKDVFTAFSSGKININTADANVLQLIPGVDTTAAADIIKYRAGPDGQEGTDDDTPFQNPGQLATAGVSPQAMAQIGNFVTTKSTTFEVHVTAKIADFTREFVAIIYRNGASVQTVGFYWK